MGRTALITALALLAIGAGIVAAYPHNAEPAGGQRVPAIKITGKVKGLYPGASKRIRLKLKNRSRQVVLVTAVRARVKSPGAGCPARTLQAERKRLRLRVPAGRSRRVRYPIRMRPTAGVACEGKRFKLRYRARVK